MELLSQIETFLRVEINESLWGQWTADGRRLFDAEPFPDRHFYTFRCLGGITRKKKYISYQFLVGEQEMTEFMVDVFCRVMSDKSLNVL